MTEEIMILKEIMEERGYQSWSQVYDIWHVKKYFLIERTAVGMLYQGGKLFH